MSGTPLERVDLPPLTPSAKDQERLYQLADMIRDDPRSAEEALEYAWKYGMCTGREQMGRIVQELIGKEKA